MCKNKSVKTAYPGNKIFHLLFSSGKDCTTTEEVLQVLLEQDESLKSNYNRMADSNKRSLTFLIKYIKDIDRQVQKATAFLAAVKHNKSPYKRTKRAAEP